MDRRGLAVITLLGLVLACAPPKRGKGKPDPTLSASAKSPTGCRSNADCSTEQRFDDEGEPIEGTGAGLECFAPDFQPGIGEPGTSEAHKASREHCSDDSACDPDEQCYPGKGCGAFACEQDSDCPTNFVCQGERCARRRCTSDSQCQGPCVHGACYAALGSCLPHSYCCPP